MKRALIAAVVVAAVSLLAVAAPFARTQRFHACVKESHGCTHRFSTGSAPVLHFVDRRHRKTRYRVCVKDPIHQDCAHNRTAGRGVGDDLAYNIGVTGKHVARWYVKGNRVAQWIFHVRAE